MTSVYERLKNLQITLPGVPPPVVDGYVAAFVPFVRTGNLIHLSGRLAKKNGKPCSGKLGEEITIAEGKQRHAASPKARNLAQKAIALDETNAEAHVVLAIENHRYEWDWAAAEREFKRAIELNPDNGDAHGYYSWFLASLGRSDQAIEEARRLLQMDPLGTGGNGNLGSVFVFTHEWDKAVKQLRYAIDLDPNYWFDYLFLGRAYEQNGRLPEAVETFKRGLALEGNTELWSGLGHADAASGKGADAQKILDHMKELSMHRYVAPYNVAVIYAGLGQKDEAFNWLNRAYDDRSYLLAVYLNTDSRLDTVRSDPRFDELRRRIALSAPH
jgi:tetratricopeptide (TPR) repeat protein